MPASELEHYLKTPLWQSKRNAMLRLAGGLCQKCLAPTKIVTHKHYRTLGHESFDDMQVLCNRCRRT